MQPESVESLCKNCCHPISLHGPRCLFTADDKDNTSCGCADPQYYNTIVSDKYMGWVEIHCNSCGTFLGFIDSTIENIYDFTTLCAKCIRKPGHPD